MLFECFSTHSAYSWSLIIIFIAHDSYPLILVLCVYALVYAQVGLQDTNISISHLQKWFMQFLLIELNLADIHGVFIIEFW